MCIRDRAIVRLKVPDLAPQLARQAVDMVQQIRQMDLKKRPSISETLDWAKALVTLNAKHIDQQTLDTTLTVLLKHESDVLRVQRGLSSGSSSSADFQPRQSPKRRQGWEN